MIDITGEHLHRAKAVSFYSQLLMEMTRVQVRLGLLLY